MVYLEVFVFSVIIGIVLTAVLAPIVIKMLYKFNFKVSYRLMKDGSNAEFIKIHGHKVNTPTLGGIMVAVSVFFATLLFLEPSNFKTFFLTFWVVFFLYGLADGLLVYGRKLSARMKKFEQSFTWRLFKLLLLYLITLVVINSLINYIGITSINFFGLTVQITPLVLFFGSFCAAVAIYAMEITDGADGLVTGQFLVAIAAYAVISAILKQESLVAITGFAIGSLLIYLYFNINPARVFMGGTGTFPVAFLIISLALVTDTVDVLLLMGCIFWAEVLSSTLQILSLKFRKKKLFKIAPIHHYFEAIGWPETKMVQRFWLFSIIFAVFSLAYFVVSR